MNRCDFLDSLIQFIRMIGQALIVWIIGYNINSPIGCSSSEASAEDYPPRISLCCRLGYSYYPLNSCRPSGLRRPSFRLPVYNAWTSKAAINVEVLHTFDLNYGQPECRRIDAADGDADVEEDLILLQPDDWKLQYVRNVGCKHMVRFASVNVFFSDVQHIRMNFDVF